MTIKDVCSKLDNKFDLFLGLFDDSAIINKLKEHLYFSGGCIYSLCNNNPPKDYDLFCDSEELIKELQEMKWGYVSECALNKLEYQVIYKYVGKPENVVSRNDFKHNCYYYIPYSGFISFALKDDENLFNIKFDDLKCPKIYNYLYSNELFYNEKRFIDVESVHFRIDKFLRRGMTISKEEKNKIYKRINKEKLKRQKDYYIKNNIPKSQWGES